MRLIEWKLSQLIDDSSFCDNCQSSGSITIDKNICDDLMFVSKNNLVDFIKEYNKDLKNKDIDNLLKIIEDNIEIINL